MILSCYRWILWKRHCDEKYQNDGRNVDILKKFLRYVLDQIEILIKHNKLDDFNNALCVKLLESFEPKGVG